ncbi:DUF4190 domain-containing protein [Mycobacterium ostraviense]|uniref:DUF4190 domain-containing protein n=1 Tax=Mycobacterium ostraviense TaxID=2738409 RepID=A0A163YSR7_9MYCO|nr:DUF4190 domain-containing protein [Mycobacterium ostraviense]KZS60757.1 hypothetical protein A4G28_24645 [Mycobacterium ostraviense]UGT94109.1 DUF4190 domain-containing protein [Mycobacterium ostraviense]
MVQVMYPHPSSEPKQPPGGSQWNPPPPCYAPAPAANGMAIAALVCALSFPPSGIIFGHIARAQIKRSSEGGRPMATAGLILGYVFTIVSIVIVVIAVAIVLNAQNVDHPTHLPATIIDPPSAFSHPSSNFTPR